MCLCLKPEATNLMVFGLEDLGQWFGVRALCSAWLAEYLGTTAPSRQGSLDADGTYRVGQVPGVMGLGIMAMWGAMWGYQVKLLSQLSIQVANF